MSNQPCLISKQSSRGGALVAYMRLQILVLMPLGLGPFSFLDPLDPFVSSLYSPPAGSPLLQTCRLPCPALGNQSMPLKVSSPGSSMGFARTPYSETPRPQMLRGPASASGEMPVFSEDAQTSQALAQLLHPGGWR